MFEGLIKMGVKKQKKVSSPSATVGTRGRGPSPSAGEWALGEDAPSPSASSQLSGKNIREKK
jgi:hypothetical protein